MMKTKRPHVRCCYYLHKNSKVETLCSNMNRVEEGTVEGTRSCFQLDTFPELSQELQRLDNKEDDGILKIHGYRQAIVSYDNELLKLRAESLEGACVRIKLALAELEIAKQIKSLPASMSEDRAMFGEDPEIIAKRALRNAIKCEQVFKPYLALVQEIQGRCLTLTNQGDLGYLACKESLKYRYQRNLAEYVANLQPEEEEEEEANEEQEVSRRKRNKGPSSRGIPERDDDMDCLICLKLLFEPVTTPCGHTFCRPCFQRTLDTNSRCPMCRRVFYGGFDLPVNITLKNILERCFQEEYEARKEEERAFIRDQEGAETVQQLPLFVLSPVMPGETLNLNIFEPRYRLMIRRVMEGNKKFGIIAMRGNNSLSPVGCEVDIVEIEAIPDGRYAIEVKGVRRFAITEVDQVDGYRVAIRPEYLSDDEPSPEEMEEVRKLVDDVDQLVQQWMDKLSENRAASLLLQTAGISPGKDNIEKFSFWAATSILVFMHARERKQTMIELKSTRARLEITKRLLQAAEDMSRGEQGARTCSII